MTDRRKEIARIIDPKTFDMIYTRMPALRRLERRREALAKADAILALPDPAVAELVAGLRPFAEMWKDRALDVSSGSIMDPEVGNPDAFSRAAQLVAKHGGSHE